MKPTPAKVLDPANQSVITDNRYDPAGSLLTYVIGSNWTVNYYSQLLDADDEVGSQQIDRPAAYQQYKLIKDVEFKVTSPLSQNQDAQTKEFVVSGTAITPGGIIPNAGDMFIADIGDGRSAIFQVTQTERTSYLKQSLFTLDYQLLTYADNATFFNDLKKKTIQEATYVSDFLTYGENPVVLDSVYTTYKDLQKLYMDLVGLYFRDFFSVRFQTLIMPGQTMPTYDHWLAHAVTKIVGLDEHPYVKKIRLIGVGGDQAMAGRTVWNALCELNETTLATTIEQVGLLNTGHFKQRGYFKSMPWLTGIYYAGIAQVVYPKDCRTDVDHEYDHIAKINPAVAMREGGGRYCTLERILRDGNVDGFSYDPAGDKLCQATPMQNAQTTGETTPSVPELKDLPSIVQVTVDDYYVFSRGFYGVDGETPQSALEALALEAISGKAMDNARLVSVGQEAFNWNNLERYYYIPVLFALLKTALRRN